MDRCSLKNQPSQGSFQPVCGSDNGRAIPFHLHCSKEGVMKSTEMSALTV